ncbi:MAG: hypothetical protein Q9182_007568 [Xanthomendoza sp. 2 TL-2023]
MAGTSKRASLASPLTLVENLEKRRKIREIEKHREDASYATVAGEHPQSRVAREARGKRAEANARVSDAYTRRDILIEEREAAWQKEVEEYGEEEARLRRQELRELLDEKHELDTSEIEEMQGEERESNLETIPQIHLRLNEKIKWRSTMQKIQLQDIDVAQLEEYVHEMINRKDPS